MLMLVVLLVTLLPVLLTHAHPKTPSNWHLQTPVIVSANDGDYRVDRLIMTRSDQTEIAFLRGRGVPYAQQQRFKPPTRFTFNGVQNATGFGPDCINAPWYQKILAVGGDKISEDCLFLNVWAPEQHQNMKERTAADAPPPTLPVLFWIHGGSFVLGGSSNYDPEFLYNYRSDVIIVTANYRLGGLGWLGGEAVKRQSFDGSGGNAGLQDTRAALQWVQRNIAAFGGDPEQVTIYGESAGSSMVAVHLVAPKSKHLFTSAIMQSGPFDNFTVQANADASFWALSSAAGCGSRMRDGSINTTTNMEAEDQALACMTKLPLMGPVYPNPGWNTSGLIHALANTTAAGWFGPVVDGVELTDEPEVLAKAGKINPVTGVIIGTNRNEGQFLLPLLDPVPNAPISTVKDLIEWLTSQSPYNNAKDLPQKIITEYQDSIVKVGAWKTASKIFTDSQYLCPTERSANWLLQSNQVKNQHVYIYRLGYESSVAAVENELIDWLEWCHPFQLKPCQNATAYSHGVGHGADVPLVWYSSKLNDTDIIVANQFIKYWQNFARKGSDPNMNVRGVSSTIWPTYETGNSTLLIGVDSSVKENLGGGEHCLFWDDLHPLV